jgi:hypothetical protein
VPPLPVLAGHCLLPEVCLTLLATAEESTGAAKEATGAGPAPGDALPRAGRLSTLPVLQPAIPRGRLPRVGCVCASSGKRLVSVCSVCSV